MEMEMEMEMKVLPPEIITDILSRLPADSAIGCRGICKQWRSVIDHPSFHDTHTRQLISSSSIYHPKKFGNYPTSLNSSSSGFFLHVHQKNSNSSLRIQCIEYNDDEERLVPEFKLSNPVYDHPFPFYNEDQDCGAILSCNGLVFMGPNKTIDTYDMFVCNPFTREYVNLRSPTLIDKLGCGDLVYGFGYLPSTNEYKVVCVYYIYGHLGQVSVYTLGSGIGWRNQEEEIPYMLHDSGLLSNGAIHWCMEEEDDDEKIVSFSFGKKKIVSFDLADEEFREVVPLPPPGPSPDYMDTLGVLGGCLCVTRTCVTRDYMIRRKGIPEDVWILNLNLKEEDGEEFTWNKKFSIPCRSDFIWLQTKPYVVLKSGKMLLGGGIGISSYDPKTEAVYEDGSFGYSIGLCMIIPYTKSFVSLKALGENDAKCFGGFAGHSLAHQQQQQG